MRMTTTIKRVDLEFTVLGYTRENVLAASALLNSIPCDKLDSYHVNDSDPTHLFISIEGLIFETYSSKVIEGLKDIFE